MRTNISDVIPCSDRIHPFAITVKTKCRNRYTVGRHFKYRDLFSRQPTNQAILNAIMSLPEVVGDSYEYSTRAIVYEDLV